MFRFCTGHLTRAVMIARQISNAFENKCLAHLIYSRHHPLNSFSLAGINGEVETSKTNQNQSEGKVMMAMRNSRSSSR
jgi:hypothetical protein